MYRKSTIYNRLCYVIFGCLFAYIGFTEYRAVGPDHFWAVVSILGACFVVGGFTQK